jgi:hypothetical protein
VAVRGRLRPDGAVPPGRRSGGGGVAGAVAAATTAAAVLVAGAALPAGRVFVLAFVGLVGGLATLAVARSRRLAAGGPGLAVVGPALAGVAGCLAFTTWYLAEYPTTQYRFPPAASAPAWPWPWPAASC